MNFWTMQIYIAEASSAEDEEKMRFTMHALDCGYIGCGDYDGDEHPSGLKLFRDSVQIGDIVAVRMGMTPIALVRVVGAYQKWPKMSDSAWMNHRRKIEFLDAEPPINQETGKLQTFPHFRGAFEGGEKNQSMIREWYNNWLERQKVW